MSTIIQQQSAIAQTDDGNVDVREQLFDEGKCGPIQMVSRQIDSITCLNGILFDIDPSLFRTSCLVHEPGASPEEFFKQTVAYWLQRHPLLRKAEVRCSGRGIHIILWFEKPVAIADEIDRARWAARVKLIQSMLPIDPKQPGINAMTRKLGSLNGKNGGVVTLLKKGERVTEAEVLSTVDDVRRKKFKVMANVLLGNGGYINCPLCNEHGLDVGHHRGWCYACKDVTPADLLKVVYCDEKSKQIGAKEVSDAS